MKRSMSLLTAATLAALAGCASTSNLKDTDRLAIYREHAGETVKSIQYSGSYSGWTPLGENALALWTRPSQAYLIELYSPCTDLSSTEAIGFKSQNGWISARFDQVYVQSNSLLPLPCTIKNIRPLDIKAIRLAEKAARDALRPVKNGDQAAGVGGAASGT